jgi:Domain of unknown function (DUF1127)
MEWRIMLAMISDVRRRFVQNCRAERAYHQLGAMDRRMLRDVGLDASQLRLAVDLGGDARPLRS